MEGVSMHISEFNLGKSGAFKPSDICSDTKDATKFCAEHARASSVFDQACLWPRDAPRYFSDAGLVGAAALATITGIPLVLHPQVVWVAVHQAAMRFMWGYTQTVMVETARKADASTSVNLLTPRQNYGEPAVWKTLMFGLSTQLAQAATSETMANPRLRLPAFMAANLCKTSVASANFLGQVPANVCLHVGAMHPTQTHTTLPKVVTTVPGVIHLNALNIAGTQTQWTAVQSKAIELFVALTELFGVLDDASVSDVTIGFKDCLTQWLNDVIAVLVSLVTSKTKAMDTRFVSDAFKVTPNGEATVLSGWVLQLCQVKHKDSPVHWNKVEVQVAQVPVTIIKADGLAERMLVDAGQWSIVATTLGATTEPRWRVKYVRGDTPVGTPLRLEHHDTISFDWDALRTFAKKKLEALQTEEKEDKPGGSPLRRLTNLAFGRKSPLGRSSPGDYRIKRSPLGGTSHHP